MMVKEHGSVASVGADHPEKKLYHGSYSVVAAAAVAAAAVLGLLDCYEVSEGGVETSSLPTFEFVAEEY